jgi:hypothetical protein
MLRVAAFEMFGVHLRIGIQNQWTRTDDLNELGRDSGLMRGRFARKLFPTMLGSRPQRTRYLEM